MVLATPVRNQLAQRRLAVRRYWPAGSDKRRAATQNGFAKALDTSTTAVNRFEAGDADEFPNGKAERDYTRLLEVMEREVDRDRAKKQGGAK